MKLANPLKDLDNTLVSNAWETPDHWNRHSFLWMTVQSSLQPMPTYTHVAGVALRDIIPSPPDLYIEASKS